MGLWSSTGGTIGGLIGSIWGPAGAAIGQQAGSDIGSFGDYFQDKHDAREMLSRQMGYAYGWANSAHQREVKDLKAAGLNPILSVMGGGATTGFQPMSSARFNPDTNAGDEALARASARQVANEDVRRERLNLAEVRLANAKAAQTEEQTRQDVLRNKNLEATQDNRWLNLWRSVGASETSAMAAQRFVDSFNKSDTPQVSSDTLKKVSKAIEDSVPAKRDSLLNMSNSAHPDTSWDEFVRKAKSFEPYVTEDEDGNVSFWAKDGDDYYPLDIDTFYDIFGERFGISKGADWPPIEVPVRAIREGKKK